MMKKRKFKMPKNTGPTDQDQKQAEKEWARIRKKADQAHKKKKKNGKG